MTRYLLTAFLIMQLLLANQKLNAQTEKLVGTEIEFALPNTKWKLGSMDGNGGNAIFIYQKEVKDNLKFKPSMAFIVDKLQDDQRPVVYLRTKMKAANIKELEFYLLEGKRMLGLSDGVIYKGLSGGDTLYIAAGVRNNRRQAVMIMCSAAGRPFADYKEEFLSFLKSVHYSWQKEETTSITTAAPATATSSANTNGKPTAKAATDKSSINACDYFPVVNGMKYTYTRDDMTGTHSVVESFATTTGKVFKTGKDVKGYRLRTNISARDNTILYYYCDNGSMRLYAEMPSYQTSVVDTWERNSILPSDYNKPEYKQTPIWETVRTGSGTYLKFTELQSGKEGTAWIDVQVANGNPVTIESEIEETGLTLEVQGKTYSSVIHVTRTVTIEFQGEEHELNTQDIYYAKGVGKIRVIEHGNDLLMGSFTTTQELQSYSIPGAK